MIMVYDIGAIFFLHFNSFETTHQVGDFI